MTRKRMIIISFKVPQLYLSMIDELVKRGRYSSRSEAIRTAIREFLLREYNLDLDESTVTKLEPRSRVRRVRLDS